MPQTEPRVTRRRAYSVRYRSSVAAQRPKGVSAHVSETLARHRVASFLVTAAALLLLANAILRVLSGASRVTVLTWVLIALMAYAVVAIFVLLKRVAAEVRLFVAWGLGISPAMYGFAAALADSPIVVMWIGVLTSLGLVALVLGTVRAA